MKVKQILKQSVGLDISKDTIAACFCQQETETPMRIVSNHVFKANAQGYRQMHQWIGKQCKQPASLQMAMEATGVYYEDVAYFMKEKGYQISVLLPSRTHAYIKSLNHKSKTDKIDAQSIAQMSLERSLPIWTPPSDIILTIKRLCRERTELLSEKTVVSNRHHARKHSHKPDTKSLARNQKSVKFINNQVKEVENEIRQILETDPEMKRKIDQVCSIPGIGFITAASIVGETNGFTLFKNKAQLVSYAGYDVVGEQSGTSINTPKSISKKGNARIRKALYFPALTAVKNCPVMKNIFNKTFEKTKIKMKAYVGIQRKLLVLIYTIYKNDTKFDPKFESIKNPKKN
jgi:transposase